MPLGVEQTAPAVPSTTDLAALTPSVAITLLVVVGVSTTMFYVGPILRARFTRPPTPQQPTVKTPDMAARHALAPVAAAADRTDQFIDHLLKQQDRAGQAIAELDRRLAAKDREIDQLQQENTRLQTLLWQHTQGRPR